jgi:hypothetical protein
MRNVTKIAAIALIAVPAAALSADSGKLSVGRWEEALTVTKVTVGDKELPLEMFKEQNETKYACLTKDQADPAVYFMKPEKKDDCQNPTGSVAGGAISVTANCKMEGKTPMILRMDGTYASEAYQAEIRAEAELEKLPFVMHGTITGKFVGACKGDETD